MWVGLHIRGWLGLVKMGSCVPAVGRLRVPCSRLRSCLSQACFACGPRACILGARNVFLIICSCRTAARASLQCVDKSPAEAQRSSAASIVEVLKAMH